ncbi:hypothetical protein MUY27_18695 [Mucilaginibacter sp. RS28]|uniref:Uncharacterized protein n=1 Tax=Mucilaginibacter straminoryzae TaxID=2932774 RepID=A0A9X2BAE9_9SPHI|nr:hypothetical protein [Mucilaginibacter straminoryzae]MCJ8211754.1 hypothetical protein [Mucilaginibacter straminoryzae]
MFEIFRSLRAEWLVYMSVLLTTSVVAMIRYRYLSVAFKSTAILMPLTFINETVAKILARTVHNNLICSHVLTPFEFTCISLTYYHFLKNVTTKKAIGLFIPIFCVFDIINAIWIQRGQFASNSILTELIFFVVYAMLSYKQLILSDEERSLAMQPIFWLSTAWLLFGSTIFLKWALQNYVVAHHIKQDILHHLLTYMNILLYLLILVALVIDKDEKKRFKYR